jgi:ABC-2 type transport system permease protein
MKALSAVYGIVVRDLTRTRRQTSRLIGGIVRPFMWLLLVGTGYNAIAKLDNNLSYQVFVFPGLVVMAALFGAMLTAISTVYDREFGMLRLMLASPAGAPAVLSGRTLAAALIGFLQGGIVLVAAPLIEPMQWPSFVRAAGALILTALSSSALGLLIAVRLRSVENFAGVINVVLFPLLFASGALYPTAHMPRLLRTVALANPVTYQVDLMRHAFGQVTEFGVQLDLAILVVITLLVFALASMLFDTEQRFIGRKRSPA